MKRFTLLLSLLLPTLMFMATSCSDDDDLPKVSINVKIEGATRVGNTLYLVKDQPLDIASVTLTDYTKKGAVIGAVAYYWDYYRLGASIAAPYGMTIDTEGIPVGTHLLQLNMTIYAVDYAPCIGYCEYKVVIVNSEEEIPTTGDIEPDPTVAASLRLSDADK